MQQPEVDTIGLSADGQTDEMRDATQWSVAHPQRDEALMCTTGCVNPETKVTKKSLAKKFKHSTIPLTGNTPDSKLWRWKSDKRLQEQGRGEIME